MIEKPSIVHRARVFTRLYCLSRRLARSAAVLLVTIGFATTGRADLEIMVPAYFYPSPGSAWNQLNSAAALVGVTAIMNPSNGPGPSIDANYTSAVDGLRAAGGQVIGYVHSSYGDRPLADVLTDIDRYASWYNVDGIFVDEMSNVPAQGVLNYYSDIYDHIKSISADFLVVGNPGTNTAEAFLATPTVDRVVVFEQLGNVYPGYSPSAWMANYSSSKFVHLVHSEPSATNMEDYVALAVQRNAGSIYVTDDVLNNPWDRLPTYWQAELSKVEEINGADLPGDFDGNGAYDCADVDALVASIVAATHDPAFDLTGDGLVDRADLTAWLAEAGAAELASGNAYLPGDANLDGVVDASDFNRWNANKFQNVAAWCQGDFNADGAVDGTDFNLWNSHKFSAADGLPTAVPEPCTCCSALAVLAVLSLISRRRDPPPAF